MFHSKDIIYEDNHLLAVNKHCGDLVQPDPAGESALEDQIKAYIKIRDNKPGEVFLGVAHRIDRPVSGLVLFAKSSKALARLNELIRERKIEKRYWAIVEGDPAIELTELTHHILKDSKNHRSRAYDSPKAGTKEAKLRYVAIGATKNYSLVEVELLTGRHHQIRAQLSKIGCPIKGDLKYGSKRSNPNGGIMLHSRSMTFIHPVRKEPITITAPSPSPDSLWDLFEPTKQGGVK
ncbi:MAG: RNA pseudouridine synthase [Rikenellaceae bacterium]